MSYFKSFAIATTAGLTLSAQTAIDLRTQTKTVDFAGAASTRVWKTGSTLPATCNLGEGFYLTSGQAGQALYICSQADTWTTGTAQPLAGSGSAVQTVSGTFVPNSVPRIDSAGTQVASGCTAASGALTCSGGFSGGTGASRITVSEGVAPAVPASDQQTLYLDSADRNLKSIDAAGGIRQYATLTGAETISGKTLTNPSIGTSAITSAFPNASVTGTTAAKLAKLAGAPSAAQVAAITDTDGIAGIVVSGAGTTGSASIAVTGQAGCVFDGATVAGDYVTISSTVAGDCHDSGAVYPSSGQVIGRVLTTNASAGTYAVQLSGSAKGSSGGGGGSSLDPLDDSTAWWRDEMNVNYQWYVAASSGGGLIFGDSSYGDSTHAGVFNVYTGSDAAAGTTMLLAWGNSAQIMHYPTGLTWDMRWVMKMSTITAGRHEFGFSDGSGQNRVTITYDPTRGSTWYGISRAAGTDTTVDLGVAASTSAWFRIRLRSDGTRMLYSVNGSSEKSICASGCDAAATIGMAGTQVWPLASVTNQASGSRGMGIDFFALLFSGLSR